VFNTRFPNPTASKVLAVPFSRHGSRIPLLVEFWHSRVQGTVPATYCSWGSAIWHCRVQQTVPAPHCYWGSGIPVCKAWLPHTTVSRVLAFPSSKHSSRTPLLVGFRHFRVQGLVPAPHCYWGSGIPVFKARFPHTSVLVSFVIVFLLVLQNLVA